MKMYEVGGCVRDELLGVKSKDIDFSVVLDDSDILINRANGRTEPYYIMVNELIREGIKIIRDGDGVPVGAEFLTVRGIHPERGAVDFVLARRESDYSDGRRPDNVEVGTLIDDLARRDFTMNAIAKDENGSLIDPFNGRGDIEQRIIACVGDPMERLTEDALRAVRAIRFAVTKNFVIVDSLDKALKSRHIANLIRDNISDERIQVELSKMFRHDTVHSMWILSKYSKLTDAIFAGRVSLDATLKTKNRGK